jgi:DNA ligase-1
MTFAELYIAIDQTNKTNEKVSLMVDFLNQNSDLDKLWMVALFTGKRPKKNVTSTQMKMWAIEFCGIPEWLFDETYDVVGDLSETIALLINKEDETASFSLHTYIELLLSLSSEQEEKKKSVIFEVWSSLNTASILVFNKLITGGFRMGVSSQLLIKALSKHTKIDANTLTHRISGKWDPQNTTFQSLIVEPSISDDLSKPYPFCLAYPIEESISNLGNIYDWQAEWKWDGIRGQLIVRKGQVFLWSRGEELVTDKFPEITSISFSSELSFVIDGEILAWNEEEPLPFNKLQTRIGRKSIGKKLLSDAPVVFMAYDLMEFLGEDLRNQTMQFRREKLQILIDSLNEATLIISPLVEANSWDELIELRENSRNNAVEGLMLKEKSSIYETGRKKGSWWKWKVDPYTIDAVMIYAQKGHGRRADLFTDYTFALWENNKLVPFAKAYSGLTDKEIREVDAFVKSNTIERFGPVRSVKPDLVFELAFEDIAISSRHKSGISVRFPRIKRWRIDKKAEEANTLNELKSLKKT